MDYVMSLVGIVLLVYVLLTARALWITRRQPVRRDAPIDGVWMTPEPRVRRHG
jgi:uncharacterized membrane protein YedE/YeeE